MNEFLKQGNIDLVHSLFARQQYIIGTVAPEFQRILDHRTRFVHGNYYISIKREVSLVRKTLTFKPVKDKKKNANRLKKVVEGYLSCIRYVDAALKVSKNEPLSNFVDYHDAKALDDLIQILDQKLEELDKVELISTIDTKTLLTTLRHKYIALGKYLK